MNSTKNEFKNTPVVVLCGGKGVILEGSEGRRVNKALIMVRRKPLFWWVMRHYVAHGATDFLLAVGRQSIQVREALEFGFGAYHSTVDANCYSLPTAGKDCTVRVIPTADDLTTGDRLLACKPWLEEHERFCVTYSDTLSDVDLSGELEFHVNLGLVATLVSAQYPVRVRILGMRQGEQIVRAFAPRPVIEAVPINGGYYIFQSTIFSGKYLNAAKGSAIVLEQEILEALATDGQLGAYEHRGAWQHFDCERDFAELEQLVLKIDAH